MITALRHRLVIAFGIFAGACLACGTGSAAATTAASTTACEASGLTLRLDRNAGRPDRFAEDGALAIVRNTGHAACTMTALPTLAMLDAGGTVVARGVPEYARFMHPGPFLPPITLDPGASAEAKIRWISGNVDGSGPVRSVTAASLALSVGGASSLAPLKATTWGRADGPLTFVEGRFATAAPADQRSKTSS